MRRRAAVGEPVYFLRVRSSLAMMEDEREVYGGDIFPEEGDLDGKPVNESIAVDGDVVPDDGVSKVSERVALLGPVVLL